jgi:membrane-associated phospholipid phosphatase
MILPLYQEMNKLHRLLSPRYLDHIIIPWEGKLFFGQPSIYLAEQLPSAWLSEFLHACYLSYYFLIPALGFPLYFKNIYELRIFVFGVFLTTVSCCLLYILFPVLGPYYQFAPIKTSLSQKPFYKLTHWLLESGASKGTAFPSLHVSIAVVVFCSSLKYLPETFPVFCPVILSIIFATVYCRFHYALDAFGGAFIGLLSYLISYLIFTKIKGGSKKCLSEVIYRSDS